MAAAHQADVDTSAAQTFYITVVATTKLTAATPADLWFGVKSMADAGRSSMSWSKC